MSQSSRVFRIFISSTFNDLKAERNALQARVFPRLRDLAFSHGCRFQVIDLRWGVSEEASLDQQAMNICLGEVARCQQTSPRPNFVVLLGDRYGWSPPPARIPADDFKRLLAEISEPEDLALLDRWYHLDLNAVPSEWRLKPRQKGSDYEKYSNWQPIETRLQGILSAAANKITLTDKDRLMYVASATEQEIADGALGVKDAPEHVLCFFRDINGLPSNFKIRDFQIYVADRIKNDYPDGLPPSCDQLVKQILGIKSDTSAKETAKKIYSALEQTPKATKEEEILLFLLHALEDFTAKDFINLDQTEWTIDDSARKKQNGLKNRLSSFVPKNVYTYSSQWIGDGITLDHIDQLCEDVYIALERIILAEIENPHTTTPQKMVPAAIQMHHALDDEGLAHQKFANERVQFFVGRSRQLNKIQRYIDDNESKTLVIVGAGGTGKSALMARAIQQFQKSVSQGEIVYRFIGSTPNSSDGRGLLESLCQEISRRYGRDDKDIPIDYRELVSELVVRMGLATTSKPLILLLDSLDQLSHNHNARSLNWLPDKLPKNVFLITSTRPGEDTYINLSGKKIEIEELTGLSQQEGEELLTQLLKSAKRSLTSSQCIEVIDKFILSKGNPLFLKLAFEEARLWTDNQSKEVLAEGVEEIIKKNMFSRLMSERSHGEMLVSHALGYLAASRNGLTEDELVDLLSRDLQVYEWFFRQSHHLPPDLIQLAIDYRNKADSAEKKGNEKPARGEEVSAFAWLKQDRNPPDPVVEFLKYVLPMTNGPRLPIVLWSRLSFDLAPYLTERYVDGSVLLDFYHRELGDAARSVFLANDQEKSYHQKLASYFHAKSDPNGDQTWTGRSIHGLSELPFHLAAAEEKEALYQVLTDPIFLEHKANEVGIISGLDRDGKSTRTYTGILSIQEDIERAINLYPEAETESPTIDNREPIVISAIDHGDGPQVSCPECQSVFPVNKEMLGQDIQCINQDCKMPMKLNLFVIRSNQSQKLKAKQEKKGWPFWKK
jgi:hypothetical protein